MGETDADEFFICVNPFYLSNPLADPRDILLYRFVYQNRRVHDKSY